MNALQYPYIVDKVYNQKVYLSEVTTVVICKCTIRPHPQGTCLYMYSTQHVNRNLYKYAIKIHANLPIVFTSYKAWTYRYGKYKISTI